MFVSAVLCVFQGTKDPPCPTEDAPAYVAIVPCGVYGPPHDTVTP